jgi:PAS domain S-box-containing protein
VTGLSRERLAAIEAAASALDEHMAESRAWRWALAVTWALSPPGVLWCVVDAERFISCGGPAWSDVLGYDPRALEGRAWRELIVDDIGASRAVVDDNLDSGRGVEGFVNHYRHATNGTVHRVVWRISPWRDGRAVARGEVGT